MKLTFFLFLFFILLDQSKLFPQLDPFNVISQDELKKKAANMGYTEEDLLRLQQTQQVSKLPIQQGDSSLGKKGSVLIPPYPLSQNEFLVSAFIGTIADSLPAFGYNIFTYSPISFEPSENIPTPTNYVIGPGDEIIITLWGETQLVQDLVVSKEGDVTIPGVGVVNVSGLNVDELKTKLFNRLSQSYSSLNTGGTQFSISTGSLRSVKVYLLGEVSRPGGYTLPALSSAFTALYYCGGPTINGSLRKARVLRGGKVVSEIDIYNYLLKGDKTKDIRLQDEDIIFIPSVGSRVAIAGSIFRPAIYELKEGESLKDLLKFAGGISFNAYFQSVHIERIIPFDQRNEYANNILSLDLNFSSVDQLINSDYTLSDGDIVNISSINMLPENRVVINGGVKKPGIYELSGNNMTVRDLIYKADSLVSDVFLGRAVLIRTLSSEKKQIIGFDLKKALDGNPSQNIVLENRDEIQIYRLNNFFPERYVEIYGQVNQPGKYLSYEGITLTDLIVLAGGMNDSATTTNIEIVRIDTINSSTYANKTTVNLPKEYWTVNKADDYLLHDFDRVYIKTDSARSYQGIVEVRGEVLFPGFYSILYRGENLSDFINRAGGFKETAYTEGILLRRVNPTINALQKVILPDSLLFKNYDGRPLYDPEKFQAEFGNIVPIDWQSIKENSQSIYNLELQPGDTLFIPKDTRTLSVVGDVNLPSTVPYKKGASLSYYITQAGGYTQTSSKGDEIVILPNGKKWDTSGFFLVPDAEILSGSIIFIPSFIETKSSDIWPTIRDIVTVVSSAAILIFTIKQY